MTKWIDYFNRLRSYAAWNRPIQDVEPLPVVIVGQVGSDDSFNAPADTSGRIATVEQNSSSINTYQLTTYRKLQVSGDNYFSTIKQSTSSGVLNAGEKRLINCELTATAGGEITSAAIVPALTNCVVRCS